MSNWRDELSNKSNVFMFSSDEYENSKYVIFGAPMDYTVSYKPGSRFGPAKLREVSMNLEDYSPYFDKSFLEISYSDIGDIRLPFGNVQKSLDKINEVALNIQKDGKIPVCIGGEHLITLPLVKAANEIHKDFVLLHFDAHTDLREEYEGEELSHATVIRKVADLIGSKKVYSFGIRSGMKEEFEWGKQNINFYPFEVLESIKKCINELKDKTVYITIDFDVFDPAYFPGTGTPEAGGINYNEFINALKLLRESNINVIGMDMVELSPMTDITNISAALAGKLLRDLLVALDK